MQPSEQYQEFINSNVEDNGNLYFTFIKNALRDGITVQTYRKREEILLAMDIFLSTKLGDTHILNDACTLPSLIDIVCRLLKL